MTPLLHVENLRTHFRTHRGEARAVDAVDLTVEEGERVGLVGESGCGKTVTALSILGLVPEPGRVLPGSSVRLRGEELVGAPEERLRRVRGAGIGMVFQEPFTALNPVIPVGRQVAEVVEVHGGLRGRAARLRAVELLDEVGLPDPERSAAAYPHELSGGMLQRAAIAAALAAEPALLVADEPTTALDVTVQARILELLRELGRRHRMALLLVSHDLSVVGSTCDRVHVMYAGEIVEAGTAGEVLAAPTHPYTRGLLDALPRIDAPRGRLRPIPGSVPDPTAPPAGCRFADRCPHAWARCRERHPPLLQSHPGAGGSGGSGEADGEPRPDGPAARCWLVEEPERRRGAA